MSYGSKLCSLHVRTYLRHTELIRLEQGHCDKRIDWQPPALPRLGFYSRIKKDRTALELLTRHTLKFRALRQGSLVSGRLLRRTPHERGQS